MMPQQQESRCENQEKRKPGEKSEFSERSQMENGRHEIESLYHKLVMELKSVAQKHNEGDKCLVRFHNCTPYRVTPFWIDFKGLPIKYPALPCGASINIDTYVSHLWFFKAQNSNAAHTNGSNQSDPVKVLAVPEESLRSIVSLSKTSKSPKANTTTSPVILGDRHTVQDAMLGMNNILICSLCKYMLKHHSQEPTKVPCSHFTGEAKFSISDLKCQSWFSYNSTYIYSCTDNTHLKKHNHKRRDIYLVEPFFNLRERCFLTLKDRIRHVDIVNLDLPVSLQEQYLQFITTLGKLNESKTS